VNFRVFFVDKAIFASVVVDHHLVVGLDAHPRRSANTLKWGPSPAVLVQRQLPHPAPTEDHFRTVRTPLEEAINGVEKHDLHEIGRRQRRQPGADL